MDAKQELKLTGHEIILVGNPNVGKSVLFGKLSGQYVVVSNYPGTTVSYTSGTVLLNGVHHSLVDTPGSGSLFPRSEDERVARDVILSKPDAHIIQVIDAKNLRRALIMTRELISLERPLTICLNMSDEARAAGLEIDARELGKLFGVNVIETVATTGQGIGQLKKVLSAESAPPVATAWFNEDVEAIIRELQDKYFKNIRGGRFYVEMVLLGDRAIFEKLAQVISPESSAELGADYLALKKKYPNLEILLNRQIGASVNRLCSGFYQKVKRPEWNFLKVMDKYTTYMPTGLLIAAVVLYLVFLFVGDFGSVVAVNFFESVIFGRYLTPWVTALLKLTVPIPFIQDLIVGEYGLFSMGIAYAIAIVLPIIVTFFLAFGFLEDSGLLSRFTVLADRAFRFVGLTGKSVLPCLLGLGCGTMACLTTRILDTKRERVIATLLMALGIPCSAQLGVMMGLAASVSPFAFLFIMLVVIMQIFLVGFLAAKILPGKTGAFIIELPPLRAPQIRNVIMKTYHRALWFLKEAVPLFLIGTLILFLLDKSGGLLVLQRVLSPVIEGMLGLPAAATQPFIMGFLRRDYGAVGLYDLANKGILNNQQIVVSLVVITLFVPCVANFLVMIKERGLKTTLLILGFITPYAILVGTVLNFILNRVKIF